jgi:Protein of unknown function (DUF433)
VNKYMKRELSGTPKSAAVILYSRAPRVTLRTVLASLAAGDLPEAILSDFPALRPEDIQAAISFAATSAAEDLPLAPAPDIAHQLR